jgi:hypothetical protein
MVKSHHLMEAMGHQMGTRGQLGHLVGARGHLMIEARGQLMMEARGHLMEAKDLMEIIKPEIFGYHLFYQFLLP